MGGSPRYNPPMQPPPLLSSPTHRLSSPTTRSVFLIPQSPSNFPSPSPHHLHTNTMGCIQSTPASEPVAAPPASSKPVASAPASNASAAAAGAAEPEVETAPGSAQEKKFAVNGVSITEVGVVFYHVEAVDGSVAIKRRFNDFKALYASLGQVSSLPPLPESGLRTTFRGQHSQELLKEREVAFVKILNAIADTPALYESAAFQKFLTTAA